MTIRLILCSLISFSVWLPMRILLADGGAATDSVNVEGSAAEPSAAGRGRESAARGRRTKVLWATEGWGTLRGRFVYDGDPPVRKKLVVNKDRDICGSHDLRNEQLVVSEDGGIKDVILWVRTKEVPERDGGAESGGIVEFDNKNCRFAPHVVTMRPGETLKVKNSDPVAHNTQISFNANSAFNEAIAVGAVKELQPKKAERYPVDVSCSIHPWMKGYLLVQDTPFVAVTDEEGNFEIRDLPAGIDLEFQVYHPKAKKILEVAREGQPVKWRRGRFKMKLTDGDNDLGELAVKPEQFN
jgi:plastocyanin